MPVDLSQFMSIVTGAGVSGVLVFIIWGFLSGWFVSGREYKAAVDRNTVLSTELISSRSTIEGMRGKISDLDSLCCRQQEQIDELKSDAERARQALADEKNIRHQIRQELQAMTEDRDGWRFQALGIDAEKARRGAWGKVPTVT